MCANNKRKNGRTIRSCFTIQKVVNSFIFWLVSAFDNFVQTNVNSVRLKGLSSVKLGEIGKYVNVEKVTKVFIDFWNVSDGVLGSAICTSWLLHRFRSEIKTKDQS